jgi:outer membrane protein assembly factor BamA
LRVAGIYIYGSLFLMLLILSACSPAKRIEHRGGYLLNKNSIDLDTPKLDPDEIAGFVEQKQTSAFLGSIHLSNRIYEMFDHGKTNGFKRWMMKNLGSKPVIFDSLLMKATFLPMKTFMNNKGYFEPKISGTVKKHKSWVNVTYHLKAGTPYTIRNISYNISDTSLKNTFLASSEKSLIKEGNIYDSYVIDLERDRITIELKNSGYFAFAKDYISFKADSALKSHQMDIEMVIRNFRINSPGNKDSIIETIHPRYTINNIYIYPDVNPKGQDTSRQDTIRVNYHFDSGDTAQLHCYLIYRDKLRIKPSALTQALFLRNGYLYSLNDHDLTYKRMINFPINRFVSITYDVAKNRSIYNSNKPLLNSTIKITRAPVNVYTIAAEGTTSAGYLGLGSSILYNNRNIFRRGETFRIRLKGSVEKQPSVGKDNSNNFLIFNTYETGAETGIDFPRLLLPFNIKRVDRYSRPKSSVNIGFNMQQQPNYKRYNLNSSFTYEWNRSEQSRFILSPVDLSSVSIFKDSVFTAYLDSVNDARLSNQYTDHIIAGLKFSYIFNNQKLSKARNFIFVRWNIEPAGNLMNVIQLTGRLKVNAEDQHTLFGIPYAQFVRSDIDFRKYFALPQNQTLVFRSLLGMGIPYGNSSGLPFEKGFYAGGANDMRGWAIRSLGPGAYSSGNSTYNNMGDIVIQSNLEYRFTIYKYWLGALFMDAGNVWLLHKSIIYPGGEFNASTFAKQLAIDAGIGFRWDFSFFIFRIDGALKMKQPTLSNKSDWISLGKMKIADVMWNFGIGYPF